MGDKRSSGYINLDAPYGVPRPNTGLSRPNPVRGPVFVSHEESLRRDLEIINARTVAELGPLPPGGVPAQPKRKPDVPYRPLPASKNQEPTEDEAVRMNQVIAIAAVTAGLVACGPSDPERTAQMSSSPSPDSSVAPSPEINESAASAAKRVAPCGNTLFQCKTESGKEVMVCDAGKTIDYSFGKPGIDPEISISVPRESATTSQWKGVGRWIYYSVTVPNGDTSYSVFTSVDRSGDEHDYEAGISVIVDGDEVARIGCQIPIFSQLEGVDLSEE